MSHVRRPNLADTIGPMVDPHALSLRTTTSCSMCVCVMVKVVGQRYRVSEEYFWPQQYIIGAHYRLLASSPGHS